MYDVVRFSEDYREVQIGRQKLSLTKSERKICQLLSAYPGEVFPRERLLNALKENDTDSFDRNIDTIVSRLRRKLGDSAKSQHCIETRYGEGYRWVYGTTNATDQSEQPLNLMIDKPRGTDLVIGNEDTIEQTVKQLAQDIENAFDHPLNVCCWNDKTEQSKRPVENGPLRFHISTTIISINGEFFLTLSLRDYVIQSQFSLTNPTPIVAMNKFDTRAIADKIKYHIVYLELRHPVNTHEPESDPLTVSLYKTARKFERRSNMHRLNQFCLEDHLNEKPNDHENKILFAVNLSNQLILGHLQSVAQKEKRILALALESAPFVEHDARYLSACAAIIYRLGDQQEGKHYLQLALAQGTYTAACYMEAGKINAYEGNFDLAHWYFDQTLQMLSERGQFYDMLVTLKAIAYIAQGKATELQHTLRIIKKNQPNVFTRSMVMLALYDGHKPMNSAARAFVRALPKPLITRILNTTFHNCARWFKYEEHRCNAMSALLSLMMELHGEEAIDAHIKQQIPSAFS